ncbi:MAG: YdcH family protein [Alphaproteobacteria bacterium]|nr:YdcH family protein [Alphaproteobacteria bacterium]
MTTEKLQHHIEALKKRHAELEQKIIDEGAHPHPDAIRIQAYKKEKLRIKDELEAIEKKS